MECVKTTEAPVEIDEADLPEVAAGDTEAGETLVLCLEEIKPRPSLHSSALNRHSNLAYQKFRIPTAFSTMESTVTS